jgi:hypothetical protein
MLRRVVLVLALVVAAGLTAGVFVLRQKQPASIHPAESRRARSAQPDDLLAELADLDPTTWVRRHLPDATDPGYNLGLYRRRVPIILDMNGRIVHMWPEVRAVGRVRLTREGRLVVIGTDNLVKEYDWEGRLTWQHQLPGSDDFPHHDLIQLANDNYLVVARDAETYADYLQEVGPDSGVVWEWRSFDHRGVFPDWNPKSKDPTHINSVFELPPNRWFDSGDERFRPGNVLVSARTIDTIFIIDRSDGEVVWQYTGDLDYQHEASMIAKGLPEEGLILVFDNGFHSRDRYRRSIVRAIDPTTNRVVENFGAQYFFSSVGGTAHILPRGNKLICSSQGGRAFELDADGDIVWEWTPPFLPMRLERLPYDHCPQLAEMPVADAVEVRPIDDRPFIDIDLYKLGLVNDTERRDVGGRVRRVMSWNDGCRKLVIPPDATLKVAFGIDEKQLSGSTVAARFRLSVEFEGSPQTLVDEIVDSASDELWRKRTFPLDELAYQTIEMCIATEGEGDVADLGTVAVWSLPVISSSTQRPTLRAREARITEEERRLRDQQLEALGYVN